MEEQHWSQMIYEQKQRGSGLCGAATKQLWALLEGRLKAVRLGKVQGTHEDKQELHAECK